MSHKVITSNGVALCQLKTYYKDQDVKHYCLGLRDGRFLAYVSTFAYIVRSNARDEDVGTRGKNWIKLCVVEVAWSKSDYARGVKTLLADPDLDRRILHGQLKSEWGHFIWAVRSLIKREINPKKCFYQPIGYSDMNVFLTQLHLFGNDISDHEENGVLLGDHYLRRSVRKWRYGQTYKNYLED